MGALVILALALVAGAARAWVLRRVLPMGGVAGGHGLGGGCAR